MMLNLSVALILCTLLYVTFAKYQAVTIGAVFDSADEMLDQVMDVAVDKANSAFSLGPNFRIEWVKVNTAPGNSHQAAHAVCSLLKRGINLVLGPQSVQSSSRVESVCNWLHVPYITMAEDFRYSQKNEYCVNVAPHPKILSKAYAALIGQWEWYDEFAVVYEDSEDLFRIQDMLQFSNKKTYLFQMNKLRDDRVLIKEIKHKGITRIVLALRTELISYFFKMAQDIGITTEYYDYVLPNLDAQTLNFKHYYDSRMNITGFQLVEPTSPEFKDFVRHLRKSDGNSTLNKSMPLDFNVTTKLSLLYDVIFLYARVISEFKLNGSQIQYNHATNCEDGTATNTYQEVMDKLKSSYFHGLTGQLKFDNAGRRTDFSVNVVKLMYVDEPGFKKIATWSKSAGYKAIFTQAELEEASYQSLSNITLKVTTVLRTPFIMEIPEEHKFDGSPEYEGFIVDLLDEMAKRVNFTYKIEQVADKTYGGVKKGVAYGMIGELVSKRADLAASDLVITEKREKDVDFTTPFMYVGITILLKKPALKSESHFSFLNPFSPQLWLCMLTAYLGISILLYLVARLSPYEWTNSHPCNGKAEELTNSYSLMNSLWCTIGALMQQGSDVEPKAVSTRIAVGIWWFFTLIMISSYTASLAAFLTAVQIAAPVNNAEDLARQTKIQYGIVRGGATHLFFANHNSEPYKKMWAYMESAEPSVFVGSNDEGVARVKRGGYAFITESSIVQYFVAQNCELMQVGGLLDSKGLGIAVPKNSPHWNKINRGVLMIQEVALLSALKNRWWNEKKNGQRCLSTPSASLELGIRQLGGVFTLLAMGIGIACAIGTVEFLWSARKRVPFKGLFCSELQKETKFAANIFKSTKPSIKDVGSIEKEHQTTQL